MTFIVAELGCNWKGDFELLKRMCRKAQMAGCDAVKFQALSQPLIDRHPEWDWYKDASITTTNIDFVRRIVEDMGLEFFVTPTYPECVKWIDPYVKRWKIRYADRNFKELIEACVNTGKQIILSTDRIIPEHENKYPHKVLQQIYCIPKYPTELGELNFDMLKILPGYSNHCLNPIAIIKAARMGAEYIEFHLTDDRNEFAIDNKVSLSYAEMDEVNIHIRRCEDYN
jgi:sialic acid synthase SpsE